MACSICGYQGHNSSTCTRAWAQHRQRRLTRILFVVVVGAATVLYWMSPRTVTPPPAADPGPPAAAPPPKPAPLRAAGKMPLHKPDAGPPSPYDKNGLVDGGIPGAPPGWKPATLTPACAAKTTKSDKQKAMMVFIRGVPLLAEYEHDGLRARC